MELHAPATAAPTPATAPVDTSALSRDELSRALRRPHHLLRLVLVQRERLYASVAREQHLWVLAGALLLGSLLYALPFGAVLGVARFWRVAVLLLGSLAICVPSLHVVGAFIGSRLAVAQTACLALVISAVASLFTFGFFPIMWFLGATMQEGSAVEGGLAVGLLTVSLGAGLAQFVRSQRAVSLLRELKPTFTLLLAGWLGLLVFITFRLAQALELV